MPFSNIIFLQAPSANDDRWRQLLREENGVVSIVPGLYLSNEERLKIAVMFSKVNYPFFANRALCLQGIEFLGVLFLIFSCSFNTNPSRTTTHEKVW